MSDKPADPVDTIQEAAQDPSDASSEVETRVSILFALMQRNLAEKDIPNENRNDFIQVIKNADFISKQAGAPIIEQGSPGNLLYVIFEGDAVGATSDGGTAFFEKGTIVGHMPPLADEPCCISLTAGDKGVSLLAIKKKNLTRYPVVYRSLLGRGLSIRGAACDYELGDKLGEGLNGPVFEIKGHKLAAKIYRDCMGDGVEPSAVIPEHILQLKNPNIVSIHETVSAYGSQFIIMDIVSGLSIKQNNGAATRCRTLRQMIDAFRSEQQRVSLDMTARIFRHVAAALLYIHEQGFVHRDVKPEHIFIDVRDNDIIFQLSDFSLAFPISTRPGKIVGTPHYCPPEAIDIDRPETVISGSADFYSLAAVCYELLTDQTVFDSLNVLELAQKHLDAEPDLLRLPVDTPIWMGRFIEQALQKDPARRPLRPDIENLIAVA